MRLNRYIASASGISRRKADELITNKEITVNGDIASQGMVVSTDDIVKHGKVPLELNSSTTTVLLHKPVGYVCSRNGQGSKTIYDLLPSELHNLKPVGRLDKDSSGLLLLTDDGELAHQLMHPSFQKKKIYKVELDIPLQPSDQVSIELGVTLEDGFSKLQLVSGRGKNWTVSMSEGRNRQIRRTFEMIGYTVVELHRTSFGDFKLRNLAPGEFTSI